MDSRRLRVDPKSKRLYVTWSDYRNGDLEFFWRVLRMGENIGVRPTRVNNDPVHNGAEQFFQWLAVDPVDGSVNVVFYDRRRDPNNRKQIVVLARSTDAGHSLTTTRGPRSHSRPAESSSATTAVWRIWRAGLRSVDRETSASY